MYIYINNMLELDTFMYPQEIDYAAGFNCACHNCCPSSPGAAKRLVYDNVCRTRITFTSSRISQAVYLSYCTFYRILQNNCLFLLMI